DSGTGVGERVRTLAEEAGLLYTLPDKLGERELTRQTDLARLVRLAAELDDGGMTGPRVAAQLRPRLHPGRPAVPGVPRPTYRRARGLGFGAVFLPRLDEKELPSKLAKTTEEVAEERRLLYVGITRARRHLALSWSKRPSPFLGELGRSADPVPRTVRRETA